MKMNKWNAMNNYVDLLNGWDFSNSNKKIKLSQSSKIHSHNKIVSLLDKETEDEIFNYFKTWNEVEAFIEGLRLGKNTDFGENQIEPTEEEIDEDLEIER